MSSLHPNRNGNGVRVRQDGNGDPWSNEHRDKLGSKFLMNDFDAVMGHVAFASNTADKFFCEYVPDDYRNASNLIREFAVVATFDRKKTEGAAKNSILPTSLYLWMMRTVGKSQPIIPKFFHVVGEHAPWTMIEISIDSGKEKVRHTIRDSNWKQVWEACGLISMRKQLEEWISVDVSAIF